MIKSANKKISASYGDNDYKLPSPAITSAIKEVNPNAEAISYASRKFLETPQAIQKPEFIELHNITEALDHLINSYGINSVLQHLGLIAMKKISKSYAYKIWSVSSAPMLDKR